MDISTTLLGAYNATYQYDYYTAAGGRPMPAGQVQIARMIKGGKLDALMEVVNNLTAYLPAMTEYYKMRIERTSGGKKDRLIDEWKDLSNEVQAAIRLADTGISQLRNLEISQAKAALPAYSDTNATNETWAPAAMTNQPSLPVPRTASAAAANPYAKLAIPAAIAAAAFFLIKGH